MATYPGAIPSLTESIPATPTTITTATAGRTHAGHHTQLAEQAAAPPALETMVKASPDQRALPRT